MGTRLDTETGTPGARCVHLGVYADALGNKNNLLVRGIGLMCSI